MSEDHDIFFQSNPDPMWIYDTETLRFLRVNDAALRHYGYTRQEFLRLTIADIRPAEQRKALFESLNNRSQGGLLPERWVHLKSDGTPINVEIRAFSVLFRSRPARAVTVRDVSQVVELELKQCENERAARDEVKLRALAGRIAKFGTWRIDRASHQLHWSDETAAIHGELQGTQQTLDRALAYFDPNSRREFCKALDQAWASGESFEKTMQIRTRDGERKWVRVAGEATVEAGVVVAISGAFKDVSEVVKTKSHSQALERRLAQTLDDMREGFLVLDADWVVTFANAEAARLLDQSLEALVDKNFWKTFPDAVGTIFHDRLMEAQMTGAPIQFEDDYQPLNNRFDVRIHPGEEGLAVHFQDVTARFKAFQMARANDERFRLTAMVTNDVIWDWDLSKDTIWWNDNLEILMGHVAPVEGLPKAFRESQIVEEDRTRVMQSLEDVIASNRMHWSAEYSFQRSDGTVAAVIDRGVVVRDSNGCAVRMLGSMVDLTEQNAIQARLRQSQKLEAIGQLTGGIAHDFNNLLTIIMGNTDVLAEKVDDGHLRELAEMASRAALRGAELTSRLLSFSRQQPLAPQPVDLPDLLETMKAMLTRLLDESIHVIVRSSPQRAVAMVDPGQLETAILNLAINARDAMPHGGTLTFETFAASGTEDLVSLSGSPEDYLLLRVTDTGTGMSEDVVARAFDPFFTTKDAGKGSGLGLSMVYGFARQSGGHVTIMSSIGRGSTIQLCLPRSHEKAVHRDLRPARVVDLVPQGGERILVVEDDQLVRQHVAQHLMGLGYQVALAEDARQALDQLTSGESFDLLFSDVIMPGGMNGLDLAAEARRLRPDLRILLTSGYSQEDVEASAVGAVLLSKPYRRRELASKVRSVLDDASSGPLPTSVSQAARANLEVN